MKILIYIACIALLITGCSTKQHQEDMAGLAVEGDSRAALLNKQASAAHLPEWLRSGNGEQRCADTNSTYCGMECVDVRGKNYSMNERYASNRAKATVLGYLRTALRSASDTLRGGNESLEVRTHVEHASSVVDDFGYGIHIFDTAFRDVGSDGLQICALAVFRPQLATEMLGAYSKLAQLDYGNQMQQKMAKKIMQKEYRDLAMKLYKENEVKRNASAVVGVENE